MAVGRSLKGKTYTELISEMFAFASILSPEDFASVIVACQKHINGEDLPELGEKASVAFAFFKTKLDEEIGHKKDVSEKRKASVSMRKDRVKCESDTKDTKQQKVQNVQFVDFVDEEKESVPSPCSPSLSSPEPPSNTPPIVPQPLKEKESRTKKSSAKAPKHKQGKYGHVLLTDEEFDRLAKDFGETEREFLVAMMDEYLELHGKTYDNYNLAIRKAKREGWFDKYRSTFKPTTSQQSQERKAEKLREYDEITRKTFEALGFDYGSNR